MFSKDPRSARTVTSQASLDGAANSSIIPRGAKVDLTLLGEALGERFVAAGSVGFRERALGLATAGSKSLIGSPLATGPAAPNRLIDEPRVAPAASATRGPRRQTPTELEARISACAVPLKPC